MDPKQPDLFSGKDNQVLQLNDFNNKPFQGTLVNWSYIVIGGKLSVIGYMKDSPRYDSTTGEFTNNHRVITSAVMSCDGRILETRNSMYLLEDPLISTLFTEDIEKHFYESSTANGLYIITSDSIPIFYPVRVGEV